MANDNNGITVWWIDDDHADPTSGRDGEVAALMGQAGEGLAIVPIHPADFEERVGLLSPTTTPDMLLIDFRLSLHAHQDSGRETPFYARDGVSLRGAARGIPEFRDVPTYLVSRVVKDKQSGNLDEKFDWVLSHRQLIDELGGDFLLSDARDYRRMVDANKDASQGENPQEDEQNLVTAIVELLVAPEPSIDSLEDPIRHMAVAVMRSGSHLDSDELKLAPSQPLAVARWIRSTLQRLRGPLIDDLAAATALGMKQDYFGRSLKGQMDLDSIKYQGLFRATGTMTLWKEALREWVLSQNDEIELSSPAAFAQSSAEYFGVPPDDQAICRVCGKLWPESVAHDEDDLEVEAAVHWRCSKEATDIDTPYGFDVPRSFTI